MFGRSLIIIVTPVVILQGIVTYAFFERHYDVMLARMGRGAAADVVFLTDMEEKLTAWPEPNGRIGDGRPRSRLQDFGCAGTVA